MVEQFPLGSDGNHSEGAVEALRRMGKANEEYQKAQKAGDYDRMQTAYEDFESARQELIACAADDPALSAAVQKWEMVFKSMKAAQKP